MQEFPHLLHEPPEEPQVFNLNRNDGVVEIIDEQVPLAAAPKTGDASFLFIACSEWWLRFLDKETMIGSFRVPLLRDGFRMVVFSAVIMIIVLFFRRGIMGDKELPDVVRGIGKKLSQKKTKVKEGATDENGTEA